ncbi:MAG: tetratricopeptide repeat protein [Bdellovibrionales bacterium]|nr:tetratricopeptide repeat protein [Bdellovibrionales bacterium]
MKRNPSLKFLGATLLFICTISILPLSAHAAPSKKLSLPSGVPHASAGTQTLSPAQRRSFELNEKGASLAKGGKFADAESAFHEAIKLDSGNISAAFNYASILIQNKKAPSAIQFLEGYIQKTPNDAGLYVRLGDAYFSTKKLDKALQNYEKALQIEPLTPKVAAKVGTIFAMTERIDDAVQQFLKAVEEDPSNPQYLLNLSNLYLAKGDPAKAISTAKRGLQLKGSSDFYNTLGSAYEQQSEWKNALISFQRARDLGDKSEELEQKITTLEKNIH